MSVIKVKKYSSERDVKRAVKQLLDHYGWYWWMPAANGFGRAGISDFNAVKDGVFVAIETKFKKTKPTPLQVGYLTSIQSNDCFAFVVNDTNIEWLEIWLRSFAKAVDAYSSASKETPEDGALLLDSIRALTTLLPGSTT